MPAHVRKEQSLSNESFKGLETKNLYERSYITHVGRPKDIILNNVTPVKLIDVHTI